MPHSFQRLHMKSVRVKVVCRRFLLQLAINNFQCCASIDLFIAIGATAPLRSYSSNHSNPINTTITLVLRVLALFPLSYNVERILEVYYTSFVGSRIVPSSGGTRHLLVLASSGASIHYLRGTILYRFLPHRSELGRRD